MVRSALAELLRLQLRKHLRRRIRHGHVAAEVLELRTLPSAVVELVADMNSAANDLHDQMASMPPQITVGDITFFSLPTRFHGSTIWRTDGTDAGTFAILGGSPQSGEFILGAIWGAGDRLYFQTIDLTTDNYRLWVSDGTVAGTQQLDATVEGGRSFPQISNFVPFRDGAAFFDYSEFQNRISVTDGTPAGTRTLFEFGTDQPVQSLFSASDGRLFIVAYDQIPETGAFVERLWVLGPSDNLPQRVSIPSSASTITTIDSLQEANGQLVVTATITGGQKKLLTVDLATNVMSELPGSSPDRPWLDVQINHLFEDGSALLVGSVNGYARELWHYDAVVQRTTRLTFTNGFNVVAGSATLGDTFYFLLGGTLWTSDGTAFGTVPLIGPNLPNNSDDQPGFEVVRQVGDRLMLLAYDAEHGREWWSSDGSANGTEILEDFLPGTGSGVPSYQPDPAWLTPTRLIFAARGIDAPGGIWLTMGTQETTRKLLINSTGTRDSIYTYSGLGSDGDTLLFTTLHPTPQGPYFQTWREVDGNVELLDSTGPGTPAYVEIGSNGTKRFFRTINPQNGRAELYERVNGSMVRVPMQPESFYPDGLYDLASGRRVILGSEVNPPTAAPTELKLLAPNGTTTRLAQDDEIHLVQVADDIIWFSQSFGSQDMLWRTDGTRAGTFQISTYSGRPITKAPWIGTPRWIFDSGDGPAVSDGTVAGTRKLKLFVPDATTVSGIGFAANDYLFSAMNAAGDSSLWAFDGTSVRRIYSFDSQVFPNGAVTDSNRVWFLSADYKQTPLFVSNGQSSGTSKVLTFDESVLGENKAVFELIPVGDRVLIVVGNTVTRQMTLWMSDGTSSGTKPLRHNLEGELFIPEGRSLVHRYEGGVVLAALSEESGLELFRIKPSGNLTVPQNVVVHSQGNTANLNWSSVPGAALYDIEIRDLKNPQSIVLSTRANDAKLENITLPSAGIWSVRVRSMALLGEDSEWSAPVEFATGLKPVMKLMPPESTNTQPEFQWLAATEFRRFDVWLTNRDTKTRVAYVADRSANSYQVQSPLTVGLYAVWARGIRQDGSKSDWSEVTEFTVVYPPVQLTSGIGFSKTPRPLFTWQTVPDAQSYRLEVRSLNGTVVYSVSGIVGTSHQTGRDLAAGRYRVFLTAFNAVRRITQQSEGVAVQLVLPPRDLTSDAQSLSWAAVPEAVTYTIELRNAKGQLVMPRVTQSTTRFIASAPFAPGQYTFRVFANFATVSSNWSEAYPFEIFRPPIAILSPFGSTMDATPVIEWASATGAESYALEVIQRSSGMVVYAASQKQGNTHRLTSVLANGQYDIRVRAIFPDGSRSSWSSLAPLQIGPAVSLSSVSGTIRWSAISAATHYEVWGNLLGPTPIRKIVYVPIHVGTSFTIDTALPRGRYQLWVRAVRAEAGNLYAGDWSSIEVIR